MTTVLLSSVLCPVILLTSLENRKKPRWMERGFYRRIEVVHALAILKKAAAKVNVEFGLPENKAEFIIKAAAEVFIVKPNLASGAIIRIM